MALTNRLNTSALAFWTYALSIALLPIGLGGDRPVSFGLAQVGLSITCVFLVLSPNVWKEANFIERMRWTLALLGFVLLWAIFQTQPFVPASWQHRFGGKQHRHYIARSMVAFRLRRKPVSRAFRAS